MRAMVLAAGRGERMRPLTDACPKPLLPVAGEPMLLRHLAALARAGVRDVVVNHAHLGQQIADAVGDGARWGLRVTLSPESPALETAGGIARALRWLGEAPFLVMAGDVVTDWDPRRATTIAAQMQAGGLDAWCVLVDNPAHHPGGDFGLAGGRLTDGDAGARLTFSGIGVYHPRLFAATAPDVPSKLAPLLRDAIARGTAGAERHDGRWHDVGTPQRLAEVDAQWTLPRR